MKQTYRYAAGRHYFDDDLVLAGPDIEISGEGDAETTLIFPPGCGIVVDQREPGPTWKMDLHDFGIQMIAGEGEPAIPQHSPLILWGQGTANWAQPRLSLRRLQLGSPDKRPLHHHLHPGPPGPLPWSLLELSGVHGLKASEISFGARYEGDPKDPASFPVKAAVQITASAGVVEDISGARFPARTMQVVFRDCQFAPGTHTPINVSEGVWVEGIHLDHCLFEGVWEGPQFLADASTAASGFDISMRHCHLAFWHRGLVVQAGSSMSVCDNSFLALDGSYGVTPAEPHPGYVRLGEYGRDYGVVQSRVEGNRFMMASPANRPKWGVVCAGSSRRNRIGPNHNQIVPVPFLETDTARDNEYHGDIWDT